MVLSWRPTNASSSSSRQKKQESDYTVWLETQGRRICEAAAKIPSRILKAIQADVAKYRQFIEDRWVRFMIRNGWLEAHLAPPLVAYPRTPNTFTRMVDLRMDLLEKEAMALVDKDVTLSHEMASLQIWPWKPPDEWTDLRLSTILWEG